jgi:hypothetical protein
MEKRGYPPGTHFHRNSYILNSATFFTNFQLGVKKTFKKTQKNVSKQEKKQKK